MRYRQSNLSPVEKPDGPGITRGVGTKPFPLGSPDMNRVYVAGPGRLDVKVDIEAIAAIP